MTIFRFPWRMRRRPDSRRVFRRFLRLLEHRLVHAAPVIHGGAPFAGAANREKA